jgi:hypothetical protein
MSDWGFVTIGWLVTYISIGVWFYTSRPKSVEK